MCISQKHGLPMGMQAAGLSSGKHIPMYSFFSPIDIAHEESDT